MYPSKSATPRADAPKIIYLQDGGDDDEPLSPRPEYEGITWCQDQVNNGDTKYLRFDEHQRELTEAKRELVEMDKQIEISEDEITSLRGRLAEAEKDAERYRWLFENTIKVFHGEARPIIHIANVAPSEIGINNIIDAALVAQEENGK